MIVGIAKLRISCASEVLLKSIYYSRNCTTNRLKLKQSCHNQQATVNLDICLCIYNLIFKCILPQAMMLGRPSSFFWCRFRSTSERYFEVDLYLFGRILVITKVVLVAQFLWFHTRCSNVLFRTHIGVVTCFGLILTIKNVFVCIMSCGIYVLLQKTFVDGFLLLKCLKHYQYYVRNILGCFR